jgi:hypothetical protein
MQHNLMLLGCPTACITCNERKNQLCSGGRLLVLRWCRIGSRFSGSLQVWQLAVPQKANGRCGTAVWRPVSGGGNLNFPPGSLQPPILHVVTLV